MTRACRPLTAWRRLAAPLCAAALLVPGPAIADTCSGLSLGVPSPGPTANGPSAVAVGDFNRDGIPDVATANQTASSISILLGNGAGGLAPAVPAPSASSPTDIVAGDLDRDGRLDLVVASGTSAQVSVHRGQAGGSFVTGIPSNVLVVPSRIALGDFDRDGLLDLVVVSETSHRIRVLRGQASMDFGSAPVLADLDLSADTPGPAAAVPGDFNRDGRLDLAVAQSAAGRVDFFLGDGSVPFVAGPTIGVGSGPRDLFAGDLDGNGWLDLVVANEASGAVSVLLGREDLGQWVLQPATPVPSGGPTRVALADLDRDGALDLVALEAANQRLAAFEGGGTPPSIFGPAPYTAPLTGARGLALGDFTSDARADLVTALSLANEAVVVPNESGLACARSSFAAAPRSYSVPDGPVSTAAADFDNDGRVDLAVATANDAFIHVRRGGAGDFTTLVDFGPFSSPPRALATADLDFDGRPDLVAALGDASAGRVQVILHDAAGDLTIGPSLPAGTNTAAVAIGDFDGNGAPDVAAVSESDGRAWVFLGDGAGAFALLGGGPVLSGLTAPRALVAADLTGDGLADLAIAESGGSAVHALRANVDAVGTLTFARITPIGGLPVGTYPEGIAAADLDGDGQPDLVTANGGSNSVSVIRRAPGGGFLATEPYTAGPNPTAAALVDLAGDAKPDIAVTTSGNRTLTVLANDGNGLFPTRSDHAVRNFPRAVTPVDADADGRLDLAVACMNADAVVVLLARPPGPPVLAAAPRIGVGSRPRAAVSADIDGDGDLDLAVANLDSSTVSILGNGAGGLAIDRTLTVAGGPDSIVAADLNRDGRVDLALNAPLAAPPGVSILLGSTTAPGGFAATVVAIGEAPGDLAVGDFDKDGDLDLAVCDAVTQPQMGHVRILQNDGNGVFIAGPSADVASQPTAIAAADFDGDGDLDLAVGNVGADNVQILTNTAGSFLVSRTLVLPGTDLEPVSVAAADLDADGDPDLAVAAYAGDRLHLYRNDSGTLTSTPVVSRDAPYLLQSVTAADVNLDGRPDLLAVATGLTVFRGRGGLDFDPPDTVVAGWSPWSVAVGDFSRDGWPDLAVVNEGSSDVSLLISTPCQARRLEVTLQSAACQIGPPPYGQPAEARAYDEGGNPATCAGGTVIPSIVPGTGDPLAVLGGSGSGGLPLTDGVASFTGLTIDRAGRRYRLQFSLGALPPAQTRSFTLGPELQIVGTSSICPNGSVTFSTREGYYDEYAWTLTPPGVVPPVYTPTVTLRNPPVTGAYTLGVSARVDGCSLQATRPIYGGLLQSTALAIQGLSTVCLDCIGGTITPTDVGGGLPQSRQWGYRTAPGLDPVIDMPAETGETYVLKGSSFPAPGTYYVVVTTVPTCGAPRVSSEIAVTVITSVPTGEVQHLGASARGSNALGGQVGLQWVNSTGAADEVRVRWNKAPNGTRLCLPPSDTVSPATDEAFITSPSAGVKDGFAHAGLVFDTTYCYSVFVMVGSVWSPGRTVEARPFNADDGPIKWSYSTGATAVVPPVVGFDGILAMSNDRTLHSVTRGGTTGGVWPESWVPYALTGVVHSRSPIVPFATTSPVFPGRSILFAGDDAGDVHAVDASSGQPAWPGPRPQGKPVVGAPGGFFRQYNGVADLIIVGTRDTSGPNELRALAVADGSLVGTPYSAGGTIGAISGSPTIDYATQRIYFTSRSHGGTGSTIWCVQVDGSTPFTPCSGWTSRNLGDVDGSPVLRGGRVYFGTAAGIVYSLDAGTGLDDRTFATGDGPVKGFVFLDRRNDDLIFATDNRVWSLSDTGAAAMPENWQWTDAASGLNPSLVLYWPQTNYVYVGSRDDRLYELDFANAGPGTPPSHKVLALGDALAQIGAPSLDIGVVPPDVTPGKKLLVVGTESGVLYGVEVPF